MKKKKEILMGVLICVLVGIVGAHFYFSSHPLFLKSEELILDVNEEYDYKENVSFVYLGSKEDVTIDKEIDTSQMQEYTITYKYKDYSIPCKVTVTNQSPPVLTLKDYKTDMVEEVTAEKFVESCEDLSEYTLSLETKDVLKEGKTEVTIKAVDAYKNETEKTCTLERVEDTTPPTIEGVEDLYAYQGNAVDYTSVTVSDDLDSNPTLTVNGEVDFSTPGTYIINYSATDRTGNITSIDRSIIVQENAESNMKVVYLTFDDGPSYNTSNVLDILDQYGVKATFFVTGNGQAYNDCIIRAAQSGHSIGLHTYTHNYATVYASKDAYYEDLNNVGSMVESLIGYRPNIIRFPGGSSNTVSASYTSGIMSDLVQSVQANGYQYYDWNVSSGDAAGNGVAVETIVSNATSGTANQLMILFHDAAGKETTVEALPQVIEYYKNAGYTFMPITKDSSMICHHGVNN